VSPANVVFLAHFTGGGIDSVLDLGVDDFTEYFNAAIELDKALYERYAKTVTRVVLAGIEKRS
jgi:hypothetical protein